MYDLSHHGLEETPYSCLTLRTLFPALSSLWARLICGTADGGTAKPAELAEPKEMFLLQPPLANVIK